MRPVPLALLMLVVLAPATWAHGSGLHLEGVRLAYAPTEVGQVLSFTVRNDEWLDARDPIVHVSVQGLIMRSSYPMDDVRYGESVDVELPLPGRVVPKACVIVTSAGRATEEVCVLATGLMMP